MTISVTKTEKNWPSIYFRTTVPDQYLQEFKTKSLHVIHDPWSIGEKEPIPSADISQCEVVFTLGFIDDLSIIEQAPNIKWVQSISVGVDALLNERTINSDIMITNTKGCTSIPIAEHALAMMLSFAKNLPTLKQQQTKTIWQKTPVTDLFNAQVCIVGYGQIGYEIAKRCKALGMKVTGCRRNPTVVTDDYADRIVAMDEVDNALAQADYVVLALPATPETDRFLDWKRLSKLKEGVVIINVGRGNAIVEQDLVDGLMDGQIRGAALDVFEIEPLPKSHPFWQMDQVIISPHQAYLSDQNFRRIMTLFKENLDRYQAGKPLLNQVNKLKGY
ncbi:D-2-hydroxyacid dehydrogenase [Amphibacillus sediminis]|uniref:D-2-hydroxyacid dehydrogenase n=1 Tax=Amphibacillus sediminis TaxID=360185 RepID=UPI00082EBDCF|nr:D-2-hydroxyacid dehydrogenase [Amphibacillus sediminis]